MCCKPKTTTQDPTPPYIREQIQKNLARANDYMDTPYTAYEGDRVAGYTDNQTAAFSMGDVLQGIDPGAGADTARAAATAPALSYDGPRLIDDINGPGQAAGSIEDYMNPYIGQVIDQAVADINRQGEVQRNDINAAATNAGGFGDARHGVAEGVQRARQDELVAETVSNLLRGGYTEAMGYRNADINRAAQEFGMNADQYNQMLARMMGAPGIDSANISNVNQIADALFGLGESERALPQAQLDINYKDFMEERDWDKDLISWISGVTAGQPAQKQIIQTEPSTLSSVASLALGGASAAAQFM